MTINPTSLKKPYLTPLLFDTNHNDIGKFGLSHINIRPSLNLIMGLKYYKILTNNFELAEIINKIICYDH